MSNTLPKALIAAPIVLDEGRRIRRPIVSRAPFSRLTDGEEHPVQRGRVLWTEVALSDCEYGCKVYEDQRGRREVQHHGVYGCPRGGERVLVTR